MPALQRASAFPALPGRTRVRPGHCPLARPLPGPLRRPPRRHRELPLRPRAGSSPTEPGAVPVRQDRRPPSPPAHHPPWPVPAAAHLAQLRHQSTAPCGRPQCGHQPRRKIGILTMGPGRGPRSPGYGQASVLGCRPV